jgi:hypothetical protein
MQRTLELSTIAFYLASLLLINSGYADSNDLTGSYEGKGIYRIEDMSATKKGSDYKFFGYVHNISNKTLYISDIIMEMFNSKDKLIQLVRIGGGIVIESGEKVPYRVIAHHANFSHLDHYFVTVLDTNKSPDQLFQKVFMEGANSETINGLWQMFGHSRLDRTFLI